MSGLSGKVAVITGAAGGLGAATARRLAEGGAQLVLADIAEDAGRALAVELDGLFVRTDVTSEQQIEALIDAACARHGRIDVMIKNAGVVGVKAGVREVSAAEWDATIAILLGSVFHGIKHAARRMVPQRDGVILSTTSIAGLGPFGPLVYSTAKHGVVGLTRSAASELAPHNIRVNAIAPGTVPTAMTGSVFGSLDAVRRTAAERTPLGTVVEAEDIAEGFAYLAGRGGRAITGQVLTIDGGITGCPIGSTAFGTRLGLAQ